MATRDNRPPIKPFTRTPGGVKPKGPHPVTGAKRHSKKPTSALGKLDRAGRSVNHGPRAVAPAFVASGKVQPRRAPRLSAADSRAVKAAKAAKRPTKAQKDVLAAASVRKTASNAQRSRSLKAHQGRVRKLKGMAGKTVVGKFTPGGPAR